MKQHHLRNPLDHFWATDLRDQTPQGRLQQIQQYIFGTIDRIVRIDGTYEDHYTPGKIHTPSLARKQTPKICQDERVPGHLLTFDQISES